MSQSEPASSDDLIEFRRSLLAWYADQGRRLPWREHGGDAYRIAVSELMLVQTTVATVIPYYHRFLSRFPTVQSLADAEESEVLKYWEGLGYYRRARHLHAMAQVVSREPDGEFPQSLEQLQALPGIGRYIAGAILSFAYNLPAPILEANTIRVMARLIGLKDPVDAPVGLKRLWAEAELRVDPDHPGAFNQAMMDLGAMVCTPANPSCIICPVRSFCIACAEDLVSQVPLKSPKKAAKIGCETALILTRQADGAILMLKRGSQGLWADFWELPCFWKSGADPARRASLGFTWDEQESLEPILSQLFKLHNLHSLSKTGKPKRYVVTTHKMDLGLYSGVVDVAAQPGCPPGWSDVRFMEPHEIEQLTISSPHRRAIKSYMDDEK